MYPGPPLVSAFIASNNFNPPIKFKVTLVTIAGFNKGKVIFLNCCNFVAPLISLLHNTFLIYFEAQLSILPLIPHKIVESLLNYNPNH